MFKFNSINFSIFPVGFFSITLFVACSGGGSGSSNDRTGGPTATDMSVKSFTVKGTSSPLFPGMPEPIDPYENEGVFTVNYEIDANGTVDIEFSLMEPDDDPAIFCGKESTKFYDKDCGPSKGCGLIENVECKFEANYEISCGGDKKNITAFMDELPKRAQLVMCVSGSGTRTFFSDQVELR
jgi:hypothetical protein